MKTGTIAALSLVLAVFLLVPIVYADPIAPFGPPDISVDWSRLAYAFEVIVSEAVAWIIGSELLWRIATNVVKGKREELSRSDLYKIMLFVMLLSFFIGLAFWKIFGWI